MLDKKKKLMSEIEAKYTIYKLLISQTTCSQDGVDQQVTLGGKCAL